jgi:hypothetical protein
MNKNTLGILFVLLLGFTALSSCGTGDQLSDTPSKGYEADSLDSVTTTVITTDASGEEQSIFSPGAVINIRIDKTNASGESRSLILPTSQQYEITLYDLNDTLIWNWAHDKAFTQANVTQTFEPHETKTFEEAWNQTSNDGKTVPKGHYVIYADDSEPYDILIE